MSKIVGLIRAVQAVKAFQAREFYQSMFSSFDLWDYDAYYDTVLCDKCRWFASLGQFQGNTLHDLFPDLEIIDENTIEVHNHPNCRCQLKRVIA